MVVSSLNELLKNKELDADTKSVYEKLLFGSKNHLRALEVISEKSFEESCEEFQGNRKGQNREKQNEKRKGQGLKKNFESKESCLDKGYKQFNQNSGKRSSNSFGKGLGKAMRENDSFKRMGKKKF